MTDLGITILVAENGFVIKPEQNDYTRGMRTEFKVAETPKRLIELVLEWAEKIEADRTSVQAK